MQRFTQEDPIGLGSGDLNLFRYTPNNPVNFVDPLGLQGIFFSRPVLSRPVPPIVLPGIPRPNSRPRRTPRSLLDVIGTQEGLNQQLEILQHSKASACSISDPKVNQEEIINDLSNENFKDLINAILDVIRPLPNQLIL